MRGDAYRHLFRSRRLPTGTELRLVDGTGHARRGLVQDIGRREATVTTGEALPSGESDRCVHLLVAAPRFQRAGWLIEKATELGAAAVHFLRTERDPRDYGDGNLERLQRIAEAALEQCQRSCLPEITGVHDWDALPSLLEPFRDGGVLCHLDPGAPPLAIPVTPAPPTALLVGPEGGWSDDERNQLVALGSSARGLGTTVLRVETAALAGLALLLQPR